jgi:hypothetical protein
MIGSSDPRAIGKFLGLNGMDGRDSTLRAGRSYIVPTRWDDASEGETRTGQALLGTDNARLQAPTEQWALGTRSTSVEPLSAVGATNVRLPSDSVGTPQPAPSPKSHSVGHPGFAESLIPVWGSGREAIADFQDGNYGGAALNGALAASDLFLAESIAKGIAKGGFYVARGLAKEAANPYSWKEVVRPWMGDERYLAKGQHGHHWLIPQNRWGKSVPDWLKNQPWNIKGMPDAVTHWRLDHRVGNLARFNPAERLWYGTPTWAKVAAGDVAGHPIAAAEAGNDQ